MQGRGRGVTTEVHPTRGPGPLPSDPEELLARILDPERRGELYPLYHRLRERAPVHRTEVSGLPKGTFALTSFRAVDQVARSSRAVNDPRTCEVWNYDGRGGDAFYQLMKHSMLFLPKAGHDRVRRLVYKAFTPAAVAPMRALTEAVAHELLDAVDDRDEFDFVSEYAYPLPIRAIMRLLGLPDEARASIEAWAWDFARAGDPMSATAETIERGNRAAEGFRAFFDGVIEDRQAGRGGDLISAMVAAEEEGQRLSRAEAISTCVLLLQAGHETTADLLGNALVGLFRNPDQLERLRREPERLRPGVEELLRYDTSVQMSMRLVTEDLVLEDGTKLPGGSLAALFYGAANRDPAAFEAPDRLDLARAPGHLAFSAGAYYCLGNALARTELQAGLGVLLERVPSIRPAGPTFVQRRTTRLRGPQELRVRREG